MLTYFFISYFLIYIAIGIITGLFMRTENDKFALFDNGLITVFLFMFAWPIITAYVVHIAIKNGITFKYKGKVIWRSKSR